MRSGACLTLALAMLWAPASPVSSDGGGDYPPPVSGDWVITRDTWVTNETILLNGDIKAIGANLTFADATFVGNLTRITISVDARSSIEARNCKFIAGTDGQLSFILEGRAAIGNSSFLKGPGDSWGAWVSVNAANVSLTDCVLEGKIECRSLPGPTLDGTRIQNSLVGAFFLNATTYSGVTFYNCGQGALGGPGAVIANCTFEDCARGVLLSDLTRIEHSIFRNCTTGIEGWYNYQIRQDNTVLGCTFDNCAPGVHAGRNSTVLASSFRSCRPGLFIIENASVRQCDFSGCDASISAPSANDLEISDSTFKDNLQALNLTVADDGTVRRCSIEKPDDRNGDSIPQAELSGAFELRDSILSGGNGTLISIAGGDARAVNTTFPAERLGVVAGGSFEVGWYLDATIRYPDGSPAGGARLQTTDRSGNVLSELVAGPDGRTPRQEVSEYIRTWNGTSYFTPLSLNASKDGLARNLSVNLDRNLDLSLTLGDVTAPSVRFTTPANNTLQNRTSFRFTGTASDDRGVASVRLRAGPGEWVAAEGTSEWMATLDLLEGENRVVAEARDAGGNTGSASILVRVDSLRPVVEITYPAQDLLVNTTSIELSGRTEPGCTVLVDGETVPFYLGQFSAVVGLQEGPNMILVTARDAAGNIGSAAVNVTRDTIPPALTLTAPANGDLTNRTIAAVSGTAETGARVLVNGAEAVRSGPFFSTEVMLDEGENTIVVSASDAAGNLASLTARVILDTVAPSIGVDLQNGTVTRSPTALLAGRTEPGSTLSANGAPVEVAPDGNFSAEVALMQGPNRIHLEARDPAGNSATLDRTITREHAAGPPPGTTPEPPPGLDPGLAVGIAVIALLLLIAAFMLFRRGPPASTARNGGESGSPPAGREP